MLLRKTIACYGDLYSILDKSNMQLSNKQKRELVRIIYPHIEHTRMEAYEQGKEYTELIKQRNGEF